MEKAAQKPAAILMHTPLTRSLPGRAIIPYAASSEAQRSASLCRAPIFHQGIECSSAVEHLQGKKRKQHFHLPMGINMSPCEVTAQKFTGVITSPHMHIPRSIFNLYTSIWKKEEERKGWHQSGGTIRLDLITRVMFIFTRQFIIL